jgi:hypothetical protein
MKVSATMRRHTARRAGAALFAVAALALAGCAGSAGLPARKGLVPDNKRYAFIEALPWSPVVGDLHGLGAGVGGAIGLGEGTPFGEKEGYFAGAVHSGGGQDTTWLRAGLRLRAALYNGNDWNLHYRAGLEGHALLPDNGDADFGLGLILGLGAQWRTDPATWSAAAALHPFWIDGHWGALVTLELGAGIEF